MNNVINSKKTLAAVIIENNKQGQQFYKSLQQWFARLDKQKIHPVNLPKTLIDKAKHIASALHQSEGAN